MPDVVVVGGGIIGAACALELAERGASVTLVEREHLAAGASGRNLGLLVMPDHADLVPMYRASIDRYLRVVDEAPFDVFMDRESMRRGGGRARTRGHGGSVSACRVPRGPGGHGGAARHAGRRPRRRARARRRPARRLVLRPRSPRRSRRADGRDGDPRRPAGSRGSPSPPGPRPADERRSRDRRRHRRGRARRRRGRRGGRPVVAGPARADRHEPAVARGAGLARSTRAARAGTGSPHRRACELDGRGPRGTGDGARRREWAGSGRPSARRCTPGRTEPSPAVRPGSRPWRRSPRIPRSPRASPRWSGAWFPPWSTRSSADHGGGFAR